MTWKKSEHTKLSLGNTRPNRFLEGWHRTVDSGRFNGVVCYFLFGLSSGLYFTTVNRGSRFEPVLRTVEL